jgi:hypothetical protein
MNMPVPAGRPPLLYVGLDPGAAGGIAVVREQQFGGKPVVVAKVRLKHRPSPALIWEWLCDHLNPLDRCYYVLEQVGGYIRTDYGRSGMGASMFEFGRRYGWLEACLGILRGRGLRGDCLTARAWQKELGLPRRGKAEGKPAWKRRLAGHARRLFPEEKVTLDTADALLLAECARRRWSGPT